MSDPKAPVPAFGPAARLLVIAPHPDDESLATGGLLQRARAGGAAVRVVFLTDGDNNRWPQRLIEKRWIIGEEERRRFGRLRRGEALAALGELAIGLSETVFLGLPDQGITGLLLTEDSGCGRRLAREILEWRPTHLVGPSLLDLHPDHSAAALHVEFALAIAAEEVRAETSSIHREDRAAGDEVSAAEIPASGKPAFLEHRWEYIVHRRGAGLGENARYLSLVPTEHECERKRAAILRHATQILLHRRMAEMAAPPELFIPVPAWPGIASSPPRLDPGPDGHPVRRGLLDPDRLRLHLALRPRLGAFGPASLLLVGWTGGKMAPAREVTFARPIMAWRPERVIVHELGSRAVVGNGKYRGGRRNGTLDLPVGALPRTQRLFAKLERRYGFFDEAGWTEVPATENGPCRKPGPSTFRRLSVPRGDRFIGDLGLGA